MFDLLTSFFFNFFFVVNISISNNFNNKNNNTKYNNIFFFPFFFLFIFPFLLTSTSLSLLPLFIFILNLLLFFFFSYDFHLIILVLNTISWLQDATCVILELMKNSEKKWKLKSVMSYMDNILDCTSNIVHVSSSIRHFRRILHICFTFMRVFHTSVRWWSFIEVWVMANFSNSPGFFGIFKPILTMLRSGWHWFFHWFSVPSFFSKGLWGHYKLNNYNQYHPHSHRFF